MTVAMRDACLIAYVVLTIFVLGVSYIHSFQDYPQWARTAEVITREQFVLLRQGQWAIYAVGVVPGVAAIVLNVVSLIWPSPGVSRLLIFLTFVLNVAVLGATIVVIVPILEVIDSGGYTRQTFQDLIFNDFWRRQVPGTLSGLIAIMILWQAIRHRSAA